MRIALLWMLVLGACSASPSEPTEQLNLVLTEEAVKDSADYYLHKIDSATATEPELARARPFFIQAADYIGADPKRLMQAGLVLMSGEQESLYGVNYLILLSTKFPEHPYAPEALMQLALYFENTLGDKDRSIVFLEDLVKRYPQHELVPSAIALLELSSGGQKNELETINNWLNKN